jgi:hypothetical protein
MKIKLMMLAGCILLVLGCSKNNDVNNNDVETMAQVRVHVSDFSFSQEDFPGAKTRGNTTPISNDNVKAIDIAIFSGNEKVYAATQLKADVSTYTTFGEFECQLANGNYTMVAIARNISAGDEFSITSPVQAAYTTERARETFCCTQDITVVGNTPVDIKPAMKRVMACFQLVTTDEVPSNVATIRTTYAAGSKCFNPTTGLATDDNGFAVTNSAKPSKTGVLDVFSILFLATNEETMDVTIEALDTDKNVLLTKTLSNVHFKRNQITKATGKLFAPGVSTLSFTLDADWLPEEVVEF